LKLSDCRLRAPRRRGAGFVDRLRIRSTMLPVDGELEHGVERQAPAHEKLLQRLACAQCAEAVEK
jgi:hypothetical protein